jgi:hypothetical protein
LRTSQAKDERTEKLLSDAHTKPAKRLAAHVTAIPHDQPVWINFTVYGALIGTIGAILGMIVAVLMYSPKMRYRIAGKPTGNPYKGQKRWHWILGMVFGVATVTWTFSGLTSLGPFPLMQRLIGQSPRQERQQTLPPPPRQAAAADVPGSAGQDPAEGQPRFVLRRWCCDGGPSEESSGAQRSVTS